MRGKQKICVYSGDPKTEHSKSGHFEGPIANGQKKSDFRMVLDKMAAIRNLDAIQKSDKVDHSKSGHVRIWDLHCAFVMRPRVWSSYIHKAPLQIRASSLFYLLCLLYHYRKRE